MPKLNKYGETDKSTHNDKAKIHDTFNAIKKIWHNMLHSNRNITDIDAYSRRYRKSSNIKISQTSIKQYTNRSEDVIADYLRRNLFRFMVFILI